MNGNELKIQAARVVLSWRSRPGPVRRLVRAGEDRPPADVTGSSLRVAAVQVRARLYENALDFAAKMGALAREARDQGASLVVFPEDNGTQLLGLLPGLARLAAEVDLSGSGGGGSLAIADVFRMVGPYAWRVFNETFAGLAKSLGIHIVSGSIRMPADDGRLVNVSHCYGPDGRLLGRQEKLHLMPDEEGWGFAPGLELSVIEGGGFRLAFPICHDATYFETFRLAWAEGAQVVAVQAANPEEYNQWYARRGIWPRVQETPVYGIASHLVGSLLGLHLTGRSGIYAPLGLTPGGDGILAEAAEPEEEALVVADLDLAALTAWRQTNQPQIPGEVIARYLPGLYEAGRKRRLSADGATPEEAKDEDDEGGHEHLTAEESRQSTPAVEPVAVGEADKEQENAPAVAEENGNSEVILRQEESREGEQEGDLGVTVDEEVVPDREPAPQEAGESRQDDGLDEPTQRDEDKGQSNQD